MHRQPIAATAFSSPNEKPISLGGAGILALAVGLSAFAMGVLVGLGIG